MKFVIRNEEKEKTAVLIPAGGLDETAFNPIMPYLEEYRVIIPVLDGSVISEKSDMPDRKTEVSKITAGLKEHGTERIALLLGISYGATIALEVLMTRKFQVSRAVLDGGSFLQYGPLMRSMNYIGTSFFAAGIRKNPDKPTMYAGLGEEADRHSRQIFTNMSKASLKMLINDSMSGVKYVDGGIRREDNLLVMYGDKDGYKGGIKWFEKHHCPFEKTILKGYGHCEYLYQNPEGYVKRYLLQEEL